MVNIYEYFDIDWEATSKNIKELLLGVVSTETFADFLGVDKRTVKNWMNNRSKPSLANLLLISKFFNLKLFEILVINSIDPMC